MVETTLADSLANFINILFVFMIIVGAYIIYDTWYSFFSDLLSEDKAEVIGLIIGFIALIFTVWLIFKRLGFI
jgi:divalent metal cation (Fe/Co/Zn/Cd) transporter